METASPRFRTDLVAQPIELEGQRFVDVTDPDSGKTFRFYDVEYSLACAMDGLRDVDNLIEWALVELGLETSTDELHNVIATLDDLGYLSEEGAPELTEEMLALGNAGGTAEVAPPLSVEAAEPMELGEPGRSPLTQPRPEQPRAPELELGAAGIGPDVSSMPEEPVIEMVSEPPDDGIREAEMSFAGLLDEDEAPTAIRDSHAKPAVEADEVPTMVRGPQQTASGDFGDLEGLTPPPAEVPEPSLRPRTNPTADEDGPTNLPPPQVHEFDDEDVSVDLSQHLSIDTEDVKEAVRASQVMQAVQVPDELLAELEESEASAQKAVAEAAAAESPVVPLGDDKVAVGKTPPAKGKEAKPVELPADQPEVKAPIAAASEAAEEAARRGASPVLWVLLILVLVGGAVAYYFLVYKPDHEATTTTKPPPVAVEPPPVVKPEVPTAQLALVESKTDTIKMASDNILVWIADDGAQVEPGDAIAKLRDYARWEKKLNEYQNREIHYQGLVDRTKARLEQAEAAGDQALVAKLNSELAHAEDKVKSKQEGIVASEKKMEQATLVTPVAGTVKQVGKVNAWLKAGTPVVEVSTPPLLTATFQVKPDAIDDYMVPADVAIERETPKATVTCKVTRVENNQVDVTCPADAGLAEGDKVTLGKVVSAAPPADDGDPEIEPDGEPEIEIDGE